MVKNRLSGKREPYLSHAQHRAICEDLGVTDRQAQDGLAGYLHRLGIILHDRDDIRLRDTSVLILRSCHNSTKPWRCSSARWVSRARLWTSSAWL